MELMRMELIDLHTHTTASDGSLTPAELVKAAKDAGLAAVAVTDHDTTAGLDEALQAGKRLDMEVVPGVEISVQRGDNPGGMHMVGLFVDHTEPALAGSLKRLQEARAQRNPKIAARLNQLGIPLTMEEVRSFAGDGQVGRPHFARALVARKAVPDVNQAFERYLAAGKPAYVPKFRFQPDEALDMLRKAKALAILAHPGLLRLPNIEIELLLRGLKQKGLEGVEVQYSDHDSATRSFLASLAHRLDLAVSGGTDFHGAAKPAIRLGTGKGDVRVPVEVLAALKTRRARMLAAARSA